MKSKTFTPLKSWIAKRFVALRWPLESLTERVAATRADGIVNARAASKCFPIRGLRYWWIRCALIEEVESRGEGAVIADVGCNRGHIKRFIGNLPNTRWVGLDMNIDDVALRECGYNELHQCDFDKPLPVADHSVDIVVFSHVIEHLPRPDFTVGELSRILRPGGMIIAGSPVAPSLIAKLREWQLRRRLRAGRIKLGKHINSMDPGRWKKLLNEQGLSVEKMTGTFFARWSGNPLENQAWWIRLNQFWGALFPALGGEIYLTARNPLVASPQTPIVAAQISAVFGRPPRWAWGGAILLFCICALGTYSRLTPEPFSIRNFVDNHQDGNNTFFLITHAAFAHVKPHASIEIIRHHQEIEARHEGEARKGMDAHFLMSADMLAEMSEVMRRTGLQVIQDIEIDGHRCVVLNSEKNRH